MIDQTVLMQDAATATGNGAPIPTQGASVLAFQITGTFTATIAFEGTVDGKNWIALPATNPGTGARATTAAGAGIYIANPGGLKQARARISDYTSGAVTVVGNVTTGGGAAEADECTTVTEYNLTLTGANTEYSQALPAGTRKVCFRCRTAYDVRYAWVTGKVAAPAAPYQTLRASAEYAMDGIKLASATIYFASATAGVVMEIEAWSS